MRRTPSLTARAREMFEEEWKGEGWQPGGTERRIAAAVGLTEEQVVDAIWGASACKWRRDFTDRIASSRRAAR